jgi:hypothetical protein
MFKIYCTAILTFVFSNTKAVNGAESVSTSRDLENEKNCISLPRPLQKQLKRPKKKLLSRGVKKNRAGKKQSSHKSSKKRDKRETVWMVTASSRVHGSKKKGKGSSFFNPMELPVTSKNRGEMVPTHATGSMPPSSKSDKKKAKEQRELDAGKSKDREEMVPTRATELTPLSSESDEKKAKEQRELDTTKHALSEDSLPLDSTLPKGLINFGATCYANSAIQLLNAIPNFRESINESSSADPFVLGIRAMFEGLDSSTGIQSDYLKKLWKDIFDPMNEAKGVDRFQFTEQGDGCEFIETCLDMLELKRERAIECFQFKLRTIIQAKDDPSIKEESYGRTFSKMLTLLIKQEPLGQEIENEFMNVFECFRMKEECTRINREKVDVIAIRYRQFMVPPKVFLIKVMRLATSKSKGRLIKIDRPIAIPLKFTLSSKMVADSKAREYELIGGVVHRGTVYGGHYIAYIRDGENFLEFNDSIVRRIDEQEAQKNLKTGAYVVAYERKD